MTTLHLRWPAEASLLEYSTKYQPNPYTEPLRLPLSLPLRRAHDGVGHGDHRALQRGHLHSRDPPRYLTLALCLTRTLTLALAPTLALALTLTLTLSLSLSRTRTATPIPNPNPHP